MQSQVLCFSIESMSERLNRCWHIMAFANNILQRSDISCKLFENHSHRREMTFLIRYMEIELNLHAIFS